MHKLLTVFCLLSPLFAFADDNPKEIALQEQVSALIENHTQFAFSLYPKLDESDSNLIFSPYSISTCLSMAYVGARDVTQEEMSQALHLDFSPKEIAAPSANLNQMLLPASSKKSYELNLANALWLDQKSYVLAEYRYAIEKQFNAKVANVLFSQSDTTLSTINKWISDQTGGHIQNLLTKNDISSSTRMLLTNAAYFKGTFVRPFRTESTHAADFYLQTDATFSVKMMEQTAIFPYVETELFQALALPFNGSSKGKGQIALVIAFPKSKENFDMLIKTLPDALEKTLSDFENRKVHVQVPKFALSKRYGLNDSLMQLGMKNPFTTQANFSGIDGLTNLYLNQVVHESFFSLDENGVTAAAATGASMNITSAPSEKPLAEFLADHPFIFFIVDLKSTEVLFIGKFSDPNDAI